MSKKTKTNLILIVLAIAITVLPFIINANAPYEGADGQAEELITEINPDYEPWVQSLWEPPSGEVESLLFALQASIGTGVLAYYFGYRKGKKKSVSKS